MIEQEIDKDGHWYLRVGPSCVVCGNKAEWISKKGLYYCVLHTNERTDIK